MHDGAPLGGHHGGGDHQDRSGHHHRSEHADAPAARDGSRWGYAPLMVVGIVAVVMIAVLVWLNH